MNSAETPFSIVIPPKKSAAKVLSTTVLSNDTLLQDVYSELQTIIADIAQTKETVSKIQKRVISTTNEFNRSAIDMAEDIRNLRSIDKHDMVKVEELKAKLKSLQSQHKLRMKSLEDQRMTHEVDNQRLRSNRDELHKLMKEQLAEP
jgi:SMC interacting uncharacterized protein involved in chromosome segregation